MKKLIVLFLCQLMIFLTQEQYITDTYVEQEIIETEISPVTLTDKDFQELYTCTEEETYINPNIVEVSHDEAVLLMQIARAEGGPTLDGQLWAMRTILNRVDDSRFDNTIQAVVAQKDQFTVYTNGSYLKAELNSNSHTALAMIEGGWDETDGALYWEADTNSNHSWHKQNLNYIKTVEGNRYYKYYEQ